MDRSAQRTSYDCVKCCVSNWRIIGKKKEKKKNQNMHVTRHLILIHCTSNIVLARAIYSIAWLGSNHTRYRVYIGVYRCLVARAVCVLCCVFLATAVSVLYSFQFSLFFSPWPGLTGFSLDVILVLAMCRARYWMLCVCCGNRIKKTFNEIPPIDVRYTQISFWWFSCTDIIRI